MYLLLLATVKVLVALGLTALPDIKRVNFNMAPECHSLLKSVCALKGITLSEYVYKVLSEDFRRLVKEDKQVQQMLLNGEYPKGSKAYNLKEQIKKESHL
tara:strand:+ start:232 stop:531 length:300 start_codon:yes stop_codon:yes gene_type:complete